MESKRRNREERDKEIDDKNRLDTVGGRTDWGRLLDSVSQRYGWTYNEIMWGISWVNLNMMMIDAIDVIKAKFIVVDGEDDKNIEEFIKATGLLE